MNLNIIKQSLRKNKLVAILMSTFVAIASLLSAVVFLVGTNVLHSVDQLMIDAQAPHFIQMHTGKIQRTKLAQFVSHEPNVAEYQVLPFLGIENDAILINHHATLDAFQDNGFTTQSPRFDYLINDHNQPVYPKQGEVYVPNFYKHKQIVKLGDQIQIQQVHLKVIGFIKDSQMNSSLASSKRFLVNEHDYQRLKQFGNVEQLIEFRLKDLKQLNAFITDYETNHLPANGPTISYPLIRMVNIISDGMMLALIFVMGLVTTIIALLCVRFTLLTKIMNEYKEIGTLKAIGIPTKAIKSIYFVQYRLLIISGIVIGFIGAISLSPLLLKQLGIYLSNAKTQQLGMIFSLVSLVVLYVIVMGYIRLVIHQFDRISPVQAMRQGSRVIKRVKPLKMKSSANFAFAWHDLKQRKWQYGTLFIITVLATMMMVVPYNLQHTFSNERFVTYMGIGKSDIRIDNREVTTQQTLRLRKQLDDIPNVAKYVLLTTRTYQLSGHKQTVKVELGNHQTFPVTYYQGHYPKTTHEIALSQLNATAMHRQVGDKVSLVVNQKVRHFVVSGIYSDVTNGGRTAKAMFKDHSAAIAWQVAYLRLQEPKRTQTVMTLLHRKLPQTKISTIHSFVTDTLGQMVTSIRLASNIAIISSLVILMTIMTLFLNLLVAKDKYDIGILKSVGFTNTDIFKQYLYRLVIIIILGMIVGIVLSLTAGEKVIGMAMASFGIASFHLIIDYSFTLLFVPGLLIITMLIIMLLNRRIFVKIPMTKIIGGLV